jgi:hypothetical protein
MVLRRVFGPERDEVKREWRRVLCTLLLTTYHVEDQIKKLRWAGHVARMGERRCACRVSVGKPVGRRPLGRSGRRWEDNIKMDL